MRFKSGYSTEYTVSKLNNVYVQMLNNKNKVIWVFLVLAKTFDTVPFSILVKKTRGTYFKLAGKLLGRTQRNRFGEFTCARLD